MALLSPSNSPAPVDSLAVAFTAGRVRALAGLPLDRERQGRCERQVWNAYRDGYAIGMIEAPFPIAEESRPAVAARPLGRLRLWLGWYRRAIPLSGTHEHRGIQERLKRVA